MVIFIGDASPLDAAGPFIDRLAELTVEEWLALGRSLIADRTGAETRLDAHDALRAAITARALEVAAWYVCDALQTVVFQARSRISTDRATDRRSFAAARTAAEDAALALLAREVLAPSNLSVLLEPFSFVDAVRRGGAANRT